MREPRDADDKRPERRDVPTRKYGQQPPSGGQGGQQSGGSGGGQQPPRGGTQPPQQRNQGRQPQGQRGGQSRQPQGQPPGQQGAGRQAGQLQGQQQSPQRQGQQPPQGQRQQPPQGQRQQTPPRQPSQTPSRTRSQQGRGRSGYQQSGQQTGQSSSARVAGDWQGVSGSQVPGGQQAGARQGGEGTPGIDQSSTLAQPIHPRTVDELMTENVVTATGDETLQEVAARMATEEVGTVVVVDDENKPIGIISDRTIALSIDDEGTLAERHVSDVMAGDIVTITEGTSVYEVTERLSEAGVRRIPVVDGEDELRGIISLDDVLVLLSKELRNVSDVVTAQTSKL